MIDFFHSQAILSYSKELISLWITEWIVPPSALISLLEFDQYLVICVFLPDVIMMIKSRVGHVVYVKGITVVITVVRTLSGRHHLQGA